ncbi:MAG: hypothetical protein EB127_08595 [Alphaproteobacteria bacterium]|jgi:hypothetical protein|nr:hypothetical protein [Alphaproteobacteria bacterium]
MEEDFYAILKLVSGEEILSKVCPCDEDDRIVLILDNPITMESITIRQLGISTIKVSPWIKFADDSMFVMDMEKVITMTEITDEDLIKMHQKFVRERNKKSNKSQLTSKMGYLSSIADARISLEKLYKSI